MFGNIALGQRQFFQEFRLDRPLKKFVGQVNGAACILDYLHRLDAGKFIKEPAATGVHEHGVTLKFQKLQCSDNLGFVKRANRVLLKET